ncbi:hypothetical protein C2I36_09455 [Rhodobacteraceae bacterium WD3A24]|nr:hypothetical protein C2I36_09455 [Rhodobacteraceae bacterium WD3A24]
MAGFTQADLDALKRAYASGVRSVTYADGKSVTYASTEEMWRTIRRIEDDLARASSTGKRPVAGFATTRRD